MEIRVFILIVFSISLLSCQNPSSTTHDYTKLIQELTIEKDVECSEISKHPQINKQKPRLSKAAKLYLKAICYEMHFTEGSLENFALAYQLDPMDSNGVYQFAKRIYDEETNDLSIQVQSKAVEFFPTDTDLIENLANTYLGIKESQKAVQVYQHAIKAIKPEDPYQTASYYTEIGDILYDENKYSEALDNFNKALELDDNPDPWLYNITGMTHDELGDLNKAIEMYRAAITTDDSFLAAYNNLGFIFNKKGKHNEAIKILNDAIERDTEREYHWVLYYNLGMAHRKHDCVKTLKYLYLSIERGAADEGPQHMDSINEHIGRCHVLQKEYDKGIDYLNRDTILDEDSYHYLGRAYLGKKDYPKAVELLEKAWEIEPSKKIKQLLDKAQQESQIRKSDK